MDEIVKFHIYFGALGNSMFYLFEFRAGFHDGLSG
jgi:hypothetical protein